MISLAELNKIETWAADIGSAYVESTTMENIFITAGPEFRDLKDCTLIIHKALYGLRRSRARCMII